MRESLATLHVFSSATVLLKRDSRLYTRSSMVENRVLRIESGVLSIEFPVKKVMNLSLERSLEKLIAQMGRKPNMCTSTCLSDNTVTDYRSILVVNKFYACTNLVTFIFKSFVSCSLQFQALYVRNSMVYRSKLKN